MKRPRGQADGILHLTGRDIEETEHALAFQPTTGQWLLLAGSADEYALGDTRAAILRYLRSQPNQTPKAIAAAISVKYDTTKRTCSRMAADGQLIVDTSSRYTAPQTRTPHPWEVSPVSP